MSSGVPEEGRKVVLDRASSTSLEIYEARLSVLYHYIPGLEITIKEGVAFIILGVFTYAVKVVLKPDFVKINARELEKIVLEIIEVEAHHAVVEFPVRETHAPVKALPHLKLNCRKKLHGLV